MTVSWSSAGPPGMPWSRPSTADLPSARTGTGSGMLHRTALVAVSCAAPPAAKAQQPITLPASRRWRPLENGAMSSAPSPTNVSRRARKHGRRCSTNSCGTRWAFRGESAGWPVRRQKAEGRRRQIRALRADHPAQRQAWSTTGRQAMPAIARRRCEDHGISPRWIAPARNTRTLSHAAPTRHL